MLRAGDATPDFVLKDHDGEDLRLSGLGGRPIVLYFCPGDGWLGCKMEARRFRDHYEAIEARGAVVVGVTLDPPATRRAFRDDNDVPFPLVSDPEGRVHDLYEAWRTTIFGRVPLGVRRCTYLIDSDGIIRKVYRNVSVIRHAKQVVKDLERLAAQEQWGKPRSKAT